MFGSRIVNREIYAVLTKTLGVTNVVGNRIYRGLGYPQGTVFPAVLFYVEQSAYFGPVVTERAEHINAETLRLRVHVDEPATTDTRIAPAAEAQFKALAGLRIDTNDGYQVTFAVDGEALPTSYPINDQFYQRLGTIYSVTVTRGG